jgi:type I restriction enzyme S subunit
MSSILSLVTGFERFDRLEKSAVLINRAVTRGLNPNAKLKPSGIEWIGEIPEHWEVKKLKYLINIQAGYAFKSSAYSQKDTDIRLLRGINVNPGQINWNDAVYWPHDKLRDVSDFMLDSDDMVMGMDRPWVGAGVRIARITETDLPALLLQRVARIRATGIEPDYLERTLTGSGFKAYFEPILTGVSVPHISPDQIACYVAAVPPKAEQIKICEFIKEAESLGAKTARAAEAQIESLKTLRSTLISHAVTGRIKV